MKKTVTLIAMLTLVVDGCIALLLLLYLFSDSLGGEFLVMGLLGPARYLVSPAGLVVLAAWTAVLSYGCLWSHHRVDTQSRNQREQNLGGD